MSSAFCLSQQFPLLPGQTCGCPRFRQSQHAGLGGMQYCIQAASYLICPCHPGWAAGVPNPAVSCQHSQHRLEEGRAGTSKSSHCIPETHLEGCSHHCPDTYLAATSLCHPRITLYLLGREISSYPEESQGHPILSHHCPSAPLGPHPVPRNPSERLTIGTGPGWSCRCPRDMAR